MTQKQHLLNPLFLNCVDDVHESIPEDDENGMFLLIELLAFILIDWRGMTWSCLNPSHNPMIHVLQHLQSMNRVPCMFTSRLVHTHTHTHTQLTFSWKLSGIAETGFCNNKGRGTWKLLLLVWTWISFFFDMQIISSFCSALLSVYCNELSSRRTWLDHILFYIQILAVNWRRHHTSTFYCINVDGDENPRVTKINQKFDNSVDVVLATVPTWPSRGKK